MYSCQHCEYKSARRYNLNVHVNNKHGVHDYQRDSTSPESMQRNQIGGSALTNSHQEQLFQPEQQRVPNYQNIKNQLDHASSSNIQWQDAYKKLHMQWQAAYQKLHESGLEFIIIIIIMVFIVPKHTVIHLKTIRLSFTA